MYFINFSFSITLTLIVFYLFLIFNLFSKFLLTDIFLPFTFYFDLLLLFIFPFSLPMSYSLCFLEPAIHRICHHLLEGLFFFLCRGTNIYNFWGCTRISRHVPRLYILFTFSIFLSGFFYCWCERNTGRHFIGFY